MPGACKSKVPNGRWETVICAMSGGVERIKVLAACRSGQAGMTLLEALAGVVIRLEERILCERRYFLPGPPRIFL